MQLYDFIRILYFATTSKSFVYCIYVRIRITCAILYVDKLWIWIKIQPPVYIILSSCHIGYSVTLSHFTKKTKTLFDGLLWNGLLKGQCHKIVDPLKKKNSTWALINGLKQFRKLIRFRNDICKFRMSATLSADLSAFINLLHLFVNGCSTAKCLGLTWHTFLMTLSL